MVSNIAVFASGSGTNAASLIQYFKTHALFRVHHIFCNRPDAYVLQRAGYHHIPYTIFTKDELYHTTHIREKLKATQTSYILLAGFMMLVPAAITGAYKEKMLNIHPALLPKFGGKGMYGRKVHEAVLQSGEKYSGITIHKVNEQYDEGDIVFQAQCPVASDDTPESLEKKVHDLEYYYYPRVAEKYFSGLPIPPAEEL